MQEKKILFTEEIDSSISGLSLAFTFAIIGLILLFIPDYFGNESVTYYLRWIFIITAIIGLLSEISKAKQKSEIKGIDNIGYGLFCVWIWAVLYFHFRNIIAIIVGFFLLILGIYGTCTGILQFIYSLHLLTKHKKRSKGSLLIELIPFLTKIFTLALAVVQFYKAINTTPIP